MLTWGGLAFNAVSPPSKYRPGHAHFVEWSHWLLTNFSFSPGTIYSPPVPFTVDELLEMVPLGLNSFTAFPAGLEYVNDSAIAKYVQELDANNLSQYATTYGYVPLLLRMLVCLFGLFGFKVLRSKLERGIAEV